MTEFERDVIDRLGRIEERLKVVERFDERICRLESMRNSNHNERRLLIIMAIIAIASGSGAVSLAEILKRLLGI